MAGRSAKKSTGRKTERAGKKRVSGPQKGTVKSGRGTKKMGAVKKRTGAKLARAPATPAPVTPYAWLLKSEPTTYGIDDLERDGTTHWEGVRNYQARNFLRDAMRKGDPVLFYHSNADPPGVAGLAKVVRAGYPDFTAWDPASPYFDPRSDRDDPTWSMVDVRFVERFDHVVPLEVLRADPALADMLLLQRGQRLSVQPVARAHFERIVRLAQG